MTNEDISSNVKIFRVIAEGYLLVFIGLLGIIGNISLICWFGRKTKNFHHLMLVLAIYDILYIFINIIIFGLPNIFASVEEGSIYKNAVPILLPIAQIGLTGSIYLTVAITIERYFTVCHPYFMFSKSWPSVVYILPIVVFSVLYNLPKFLELQVNSSHQAADFNITNNDTQLSLPTDEENIFVLEKIEPTQLRLNPTYIKVYLIYMNFIIHGIIPFITLSS